jgi:hypothetical protein
LKRKNLTATVLAGFFAAAFGLAGTVQAGAGPPVDENQLSTHNIAIDNGFVQEVPDIVGTITSNTNSADVAPFTRGRMNIPVLSDLREGTPEKPKFEQDLLESQSSFNHREKNPEVLSRLSHQAGAAKT